MDQQMSFTITSLLQLGWQDALLAQHVGASTFRL